MECFENLIQDLGAHNVEEVRVKHRPSVLGAEGPGSAISGERSRTVPPFAGGVEEGSGRSAAAVELPVTACDPLDRIRVRDVGGSVGDGQLHGACPGSPPFSLYRRVTEAHQPLNGWGSPIRSGSGRWAMQGRTDPSAWPLGHAGRDQI